MACLAESILYLELALRGRSHNRILFLENDSFLRPCLLRLNCKEESKPTTRKKRNADFHVPCWESTNQKRHTMRSHIFWNVVCQKMSSLRKKSEERKGDNRKSGRHKIIVLDDESLGHEAIFFCPAANLGPFFANFYNASPTRKVIRDGGNFLQYS